MRRAGSAQATTTLHAISQAFDADPGHADMHAESRCRNCVTTSSHRTSASFAPWVTSSGSRSPAYGKFRARQVLLCGPGEKGDEPARITITPRNPKSQVDFEPVAQRYGLL